MTEIAPEERIANEIIERLQAVAPGKVSRVNRDATDFMPVDGTIVVKQADIERIEESDCPGHPPAVAFEASYAVLCYVRQSDRSKIADQSRVNHATANARKAITVGSMWHTFGGVAFDAEVSNAAPFEQDGEGTMAGGAFVIAVRYRVSELDPFEVRA